MTNLFSQHTVMIIEFVAICGLVTFGYVVGRMVQYDIDIEVMREALQEAKKGK